jgi:SAM-dependent methyltransferase
MERMGVIEYYEAIDEPGRLTQGRGRLELARVQELVRRFAPAVPAKVLDVGGAGGVHAACLAEAGYAVHLIDPVAGHIESARALAASLDRPFTAELGDARSLPVADATFDLVLLFGPLYHLIERAERITAWREAARVTRPGGVILGMAISRWAGLLDATFRPPAEPTPGFVPLAYFHAPDELAWEATEAELRVTGTYGVEGGGWLITDFDARWDDPAERELLVERARSIEQVPELMGLHSHWICVAER